MTLYKTKGKAKEDKGKATATAMEAISGGFGPSGKRKISYYYGEDTVVAKVKAHESLCLFFASLHIPKHHADHPLFRNMLRAVAEAGPGYVPPGRKYVSGAGLQQCRIRIEKGLGPIKKTWGKRGVTIASDMMTNRNGRAQANVLLINDDGAMFSKSIDSGKDQKTGTYIADMLRPIVEEVEPQNVVALCTEGGSNYRSACQKLGVEFPHIELTPCTTHLIDLVLEDVGKMDWKKKLVDRGNDMINFLRKHHWTRAMLRDTTLPVVGNMNDNE
ncbi:unnamed protein product [Closterium sp. NIES-53]